MYDGINNGGGASAASNPLADYLNDGTKGLDIGTCVANLPAGSLNFLVANIAPSNIGDGVPDVLVTQVADPSGSTDKYAFTDANGDIIGNTMDIRFTNIAPVGTWTADFYEASVNPRTLTPGFTNTDREIRLWAADLSEFGITAANYSQISRFRITLSGNSDVAFVAYNNRTFNIGTILPLKLIDFSVNAVNEISELSWTTATEENTSHFIVERSNDNRTYTAVGQLNAAGNSSSLKKYGFTDAHTKKGSNYYRLKMVDVNGKSTYSNVVVANFNSSTTSISVFPNPATTEVSISHPAASGKETLTVYNAVGAIILKTAVSKNSSQTRLNTQSLAKGVYYISWQNEFTKKSESLVIR
jgi:hypothetical protein